MNPPVQNEPLHGFPSDLAPDGIESGQNNRIRSVINEHSDAGGGFKGANVPAFAADDPAFDLIAIEGDGAVEISKVCSPA
jgi:hypothetical protein